MSNEMTELIDKAEREGLWLHCQYQDLWFSPQGLRDAQARGRFRWGVVNWTLRDPVERLNRAEREAAAATARVEHIRKELGR